MGKNIFKIGGLILWSTIAISCSCQSESRETHKKEILEKPKLLPNFIPFDSVHQQKFENFFAEKQRQRRFNGNVAIYHGGQLYTANFGVKNFIEKTPLNDSCRFQLASVSKPITAIVTMKLVEQGKINLHDSIQTYLPNFPYSGITVEMLLSHRSGLGNYMYITDSIWVDQSIAMCNEDIYDSIVSLQPSVYYPPNNRFNYCNTNYFLLAEIAERVTQKPFEVLVEQVVFHPLKMEDSFVLAGMNQRQFKNVALGSENGRWHIPDYYLNGITGDKGVHSTPMDLLRLHFALEKNSILSDSLTQEMYVPRSKFNRKGTSYALGWRIVKETSTSPQVIYHAGWWRGYRSYFIRIPDQDICIIALSNLSHGKFIPRQELIDLVLN